MSLSLRDINRLLTSALLVFLLGIFINPRAGWCQTFVSGTVATADGMVVASGAIALEKGELHNNAFQAGGKIESDGTFKIPLPSGGPWGLHVYSEKYIYFPLQIQIKQGRVNEVPVILPVDASSDDDPRISNIQFNQISSRGIQVTMQVSDPNHNLGPQMLAIDTVRFKSYRLLPRDGDLKDWKAAFPEGQYVSPVIHLAEGTADPQTWLFVVADHQCSNGPVLNGFGQSIFRPPVAAVETLRCEVPGVWKSNFDKLYQFSAVQPGLLTGTQFEGELTIDKMVQNDIRVQVDYHYQGQKGTAALVLTCQDAHVTLQGTYRLPDRSGEWLLTKIQNVKDTNVGQGKKLFENNCAACHYADSKETKVGPGLEGLSKRETLPTSGFPINEENLRQRIVNGGEKMPPFRHLTNEEVNALINFLLSL
jgi:cytochrome c5